MSDRARQERRGPGSGRCLFTVDLEEYFEVKALREFIRPAEWESLPRRIERSVDPLLGTLDRYGARATFFASPWAADARPVAIRRIVRAGHEVGVLMRMPTGDVSEDQRRNVWRRTVRETRDRLRQLTGQDVVGLRSARFHHAIPAREALSILAEEGFRYDSTLSRDAVRSMFDTDVATFPIRLPLGEGSLVAVPPSTARLFGHRLFTAGRTAFRVLPLVATRLLLARDASGSGRAVFSMRSWEMDTVQPTLPVSLASRVRLYWGLDRVQSRLDSLLKEFSFDSVAGALGPQVDSASDRKEDRESERPGNSGPGARRLHG